MKVETFYKIRDYVNRSRWSKHLPPEIREDITSDVLLNFREGTVLKRQVIDSIRKLLKIRSITFVSLDEVSGGYYFREPLILDNFFHGIKKRDAEIFYLHYVEEAPYSVLGELYEINPDYAKSLNTYTRAKLRELHSTSF